MTFSRNVAYLQGNPQTKDHLKKGLCLLSEGHGVRLPLFMKETTVELSEETRTMAFRGRKIPEGLLPLFSFPTG